MIQLVTFRIVDEEYVDTAISGDGAARYPGRWNLPGQRAIYAAQNLSLAMLETLVNLEYVDLLEKHWVYFEMKSGISPISVTPPKGWPNTPLSETRRIGSELIHITSVREQSVWFRVPSVVVPGEFNYVFNPANPRFNSLVKVRGPYRLRFDKRLLGILSKTTK